MKEKLAKLPLALHVILVFVFLYLPILTLICFSFNSEAFPSHWGSFTLKWYYELYSDSELWKAFFCSFFIAIVSTTLSLALGMGFLFLKDQKGRLDLAFGLFYPNLVVPESMIAVSLVYYFSFFKIHLGLITLVASHTVLGLGFAIPILYSCYNNIDNGLTEASESLGASSVETYFKIILPMLKPAIISIGLLIFVLSFDDFIFSYFCSGASTTTLSLYILSMLRVGISPTINALSTILLLISSFLVYMFFFRKTSDKLL